MTFIQTLLDNELFLGLFGGSLLAVVLFFLRDIPRHLWNYGVWRFTAEVVVFNDDTAFDAVSEWLVDHEYAKRCRHMRLSTLWRWEDDTRVAVAPGIGWHWLKWRGRVIIVHREVTETGNLLARSETIRLHTLTAWGGVETLRALLDEVTQQSATSREHVQVFMFRSFWRKIARKVVRALDTVVLADRLGERILEDAQRFLGAQRRYIARGIPYRRAYLFSGPPGTGKTSFAMVLAGALGRPVYALNIASVANDDELVVACAMVPQNAILLIEDVDAVRIAKDRSDIVFEATPDGGKPIEKGITLSGLLNALDGTFTRDGRILVMTSNHADRLDPALLRPGRCDQRFEFGLAGPDEAYRMAVQYGFDRRSARRMVDDGTIATPLAPAFIQERLMSLEAEPPKVTPRTRVMDCGCVVEEAAP